MQATIRDHTTGETLGSMRWSLKDHRAYIAGTHHCFQWPGGIAVAGDVLSPEMGIDPTLTIYLDATATQPRPV